MTSPSPITAAAGLPSSTARPRRRRARREWPGRIATLLGLLLGIVIILFPVAGTYYNNWHAYQFAQEQSAKQKQEAATPAGKRAIDAARQYNATLAPNLLSDPWNGEDPASTPAYRRYEHLLGGPTDVMATMRFPDLAIDLPIYHGTSEWALGRGIGHMYGTALPVGGPGTHSALAAHRGLPQMTGFDRLPEAKVGEQLFVDVAGETLAYKVTGINTVLPADLTGLRPAAGKDQITLITCTPYGINTHRLLVTADRIPWSQADKAKATWHGFDWSIQSWMRLRVGLAAATLLLMLWLVIAWIREDRRRARRLAHKRAAALAATKGSTP